MVALQKKEHVNALPWLDVENNEKWMHIRRKSAGGSGWQAS
jgi:hypothetical protein